MSLTHLLDVREGDTEKGWGLSERRSEGQEEALGKVRQIRECGLFFPCY